MHVAIIMDGNGRWAQERGWPRWKGHVAGVDSVRELVQTAPQMGITTLTLYAFSADNWKRPPSEIAKLFRLLRRYCRKEARELNRQGVRVSAIGRRDRIPPRVMSEFERLEDRTRDGSRLHLRLALDYSSREAILNAVRTLAASSQHNTAPSGISQDDIHRIITDGVPDPDLLIRTAGEKRLSDFLLWELSYAELHFTDVKWPEFRSKNLELAVADFRNRTRRFGAAEPSTEIQHQEARKRLAG